MIGGVGDLGVFGFSGEIGGESKRWVAPIGKVGGTDWKGGWHRLGKRPIRWGQLRGSANWMKAWVVWDFWGLWGGWMALPLGEVEVPAVAGIAKGTSDE